MKFSLPLFPEQASTVAGQVDALFYFLTAVSTVFSLLIAGLIIYFAVKYRRRSPEEIGVPITGSHGLEALWIVIPFGIALVMFVWGASVYFTMYRVPTDAMEIHVVGKQWMWKFQHMEGQREINELHVPVGRTVKLVMASQDVIHSFFVPAFRVKADVIPGTYRTLWFQATKPGTYHLFCAEYCGTQHSGMIGRVIVMEPAQYQDWLSGSMSTGVEGSPVAAGQRLFEDLACHTCHRLDQQGIGPMLTGLFGKQVQLRNGQVVTADENYIRESILNPAAKIAASFQPVMPPYQGRITEEQLLQLLTYIKSLTTQQPQATKVTPPQGGPGAPGLPGEGQGGTTNLPTPPARQPSATETEAPS
ncbi:MAG TPA: cytochrome c oxidase subunit II [Candidatus Binatia bacterium]|jgi:cytochrome c oxidase subunit 2|nr:cytochrome c oxidase subunit II [Candidatus Binatia bacterium]